MHPAGRRPPNLLRCHGGAGRRDPSYAWTPACITKELMILINVAADS